MESVIKTVKEIGRDKNENKVRKIIKVLKLNFKTRKYNENVNLFLAQQHIRKRLS